MSGNQYTAWLLANGRTPEGLGTKEGFNEYVSAGPRAPLERLTRTQYDSLSEEEREDYNSCRGIVHENPPTYRTPQLMAGLFATQQVMACRFRDGDRLRGGIYLDAAPQVGKTTIAKEYARSFARAELRTRGPLTDRGDLRLPVAWVHVDGGTLKGLTKSLLYFYGHPAATSGARIDLRLKLRDLISRCETQLIVLDDLHQIKPATDAGGEVIQYLKALGNASSVSFIHTGVGLKQRGFFEEGRFGDEGLQAQTGRRMVRHRVSPFDLSTPEHAEAWKRLLESLGAHLILLEGQPGDLADLSEELMARTQGHIGSLADLLTRAWQTAIFTGVERITGALLATIPLDATSERILKGDDDEPARKPPAPRPRARRAPRKPPEPDAA